jgi:hypothetical protein
MKTRLTLLLVIATYLLLAFSACSDDNNPSDQITLYDIVAFRGQDDGYSHFSIQQSPDADITLYRAQHAVIDTAKIAPGQRLMIVYTADQGAYHSGNINVKAYRLINNAQLLSQAISGDDLADLEPIYLLSTWRSESFLNFHVSLPYSDQPRLFSLVLDTNSPNPSCPDLYLLHRRQQIAETFNRAYYISFDISDLTSNPAIVGFTLHLDNANLPQDSIPFAL